MITVISAPPFATIQDLGRTGFRGAGVPPSGLADRDSGLALNAALGNEPNAAMIEWAVAGGVLRFDRGATVAIGGAEAVVAMNGRPVQEWTPLEAQSGSELQVGRISRGRFLLIAVRGGIDVPVVLGSRATLASAGIGGLDGRRLRTGDVLSIADTTGGSVSTGDRTNPATRNGGRTQVGAGAAIRIMRGPQADLFDEGAWARFLGAELTVSRASDRAGYRLDGVTLTHPGDAALPSEPTCVGEIQVPGGGSPIVLMPDGPTVGGYPRIAVIRKRDIARFAQLAPGDRVSFVLTS